MLVLEKNDMLVLQNKIMCSYKKNDMLVKQKTKMVDKLFWRKKEISWSYKIKWCVDLTKKVNDMLVLRKKNDKLVGLKKKIAYKSK